MKTTTLEFPKGLQVMLINIFNPISIVKTESKDKNKTIIEFIGHEDYAVEVMNSNDLLKNNCNIIEKF